MNSRSGLIILFFLLSVIPVQARKVISVNSQSQFDNLSQELTKAMKGADNEIYVVFSPGQYEWSEQHIRLVSVKAPSKDIHIVGNNAVLVPKGKLYREGDSYSGEFSVDNSWMFAKNDVDIWSKAQFSVGEVKIVDAKKKECRLKTQMKFPKGVDCKNAYILVTQWYVSGVYKISKIDGQFIYFTVDDLVADSYRGGYSINNDINFKGIDPRFKLCNLDLGEDGFCIRKGKVHLPDQVDYVWEGTANNFLSINTCSFHSLEVSGFSFLGSANGQDASVISFKQVNCEKVLIHQCEFVGLRSNVMGFTATPNVVIENNTFESCYRRGIASNVTSENTVVRNNAFHYMGLGMMNSTCVSCRGANFTISGNTFEDYGYSGIAVGEHYSHEKKAPCNGIVEDNVLRFTQAYMDDIENYGLMDSGAIYLRTKMDGVIIRNNRIDGFSGMASNRGIFCDDGAYNFEITGNIITGIVNSYCIDSRRCANVEERNHPGTGIQRANINIVIRDNVMDGRIRFVGNEEGNNGCYFGNNYFLATNEKSKVSHVIENVEIDGSEQTLVITGEQQGKLGLSRESFRKIKRIGAMRAMRLFFYQKSR